MKLIIGKSNQYHSFHKLCLSTGERKTERRRIIATREKDLKDSRDYRGIEREKQLKIREIETSVERERQTVRESCVSWSM
jgi:hypothetical protein